MLSNGTIRFTSLRFEDAGLYICYARNVVYNFLTRYVEYHLGVFGKHSLASLPVYVNHLFITAPISSHIV